MKCHHCVIFCYLWEISWGPSSLRQAMRMSDWMKSSNHPSFLDQYLTYWYRWQKCSEMLKQTFIYLRADSFDFVIFISIFRYITIKLGGDPNRSHEKTISDSFKLETLCVVTHISPVVTLMRRDDRSQTNDQCIQSGKMNESWSISLCFQQIYNLKPLFPLYIVAWMVTRKPYYSFKCDLFQQL